MLIIIEKAVDSDVCAVAALYDRVSDHFAQTINYCAPEWQKGSYPTLADAQCAFDEGSLYVAKRNRQVCVACTIDRNTYFTVELPWGIEAGDRDCVIAHTLAVDPALRGKGYGKAMVDFAIAQGLKTHALALRLSTHQINIPACALYRKCGLKHICDWTGDAGSGIDTYSVFEYVY